ncbi:MAG: RNA-binding protein [Sulfurovum sp.]|nr:RNA-binding protein [Sulfurovum sp.]
MRTKMSDFLTNLQKKWGITDINHIKPGIGESTRVLLRRVPYLLIIQDLDSKETEHLILLAKEKETKVIEDKYLPYKALAIIKNVREKVLP